MRIGIPYLVLHLGRPIAEHPIMDDEIVEHPGGRAAAAAERAADIDESTQRRFDTAIAGRLE